MSLLPRPPGSWRVLASHWRAYSVASVTLLAGTLASVVWVLDREQMRLAYNDAVAQHGRFDSCREACSSWS